MKLSLLEISAICSGVGPVRGYVNSVRTSVCERGAEIELTEIIDGEVSAGELLSRMRERERDMTLNIEPEPEKDGRWPGPERDRMRRM